MVGKCLVLPIGSGLIGFMCLGWIVEVAKMVVYSIDTYLSLPFISKSGHSFVSRFVIGWPFHIAHLFIPGRQPQITNTVVVSNPIDMIDFLAGPLAIMHRPANSVRAQETLIDPDYNISRRVMALNYTARYCFAARDIPPQITRLRIICQQLFQAIGRRIFHGGNMATPLVLCQAQ